MTTENVSTPEDDDLAFTREMRRKLVQALAPNGKCSDDARQAGVLAGVLSDMDRQAMGIKRLKADEQSNRNNGDTAAVIAEFLSKLSGANMANNTETTGKAPTLPADLPKPVINPGAMDQDCGNETFAQFTARMENQK